MTDYPPLVGPPETCLLRRADWHSQEAQHQPRIY
jgi:hypothetical protein